MIPRYGAELMIQTSEWGEYHVGHEVISNVIFTLG